MKKIFPVTLIVASLIMNAVFISSWAVHTIRLGRFAGKMTHCAFNADTPHPLYRSLGISDQQWKAMQPALTRFSDSSKYINDSIDTYRAIIIELLEKDSVDMDSVAEVQNSVLRMQNKLQLLVIDQLLSEKNILSPKQRKDLFLLLRNSCSRYQKGLLSDSSGGLSGMGYNCRMNNVD